MLTFFPTIVAGDPVEGYAAEVLGAGVNGQGETVDEALRDAAEVLQEIIDDAIRDGEPVPTPGAFAADDLARGLAAMLQARMPAAAA
jgi:predicted RNase H-like HicB family nuclease